MYRVLHVIDSLGYGGTELQLALNLGGMKADRFENYVCYLHGPSHLEPALDKLGVQVFGLGLTGSRQWVRGVLRLRRLVKSLNIDLIHTNLFEADVIGGVTGRLMKRPVISTIANVCFEPEFLIDNPSLSRVKLAFPKHIRSLIANACNAHLVAVSQTVAQSAIKQLRVPPQKTSVIHRALSRQWLEPPDDDYLKSLRTQLGLAGSGPVLLNVGRLIPQKGQCYLIEGMREVVQAFPAARLLVAGEGYLRASLTDLRDRLGLTDHVTFLGRRNDIKALHAVSDIFVFPSLFEGCPNALIEAMVMGKPCVASKISSTEEVMEEGVTGLLTPARDPQSLANAIIQLCSNPERANLMGQKARAAALERFTVSNAVEKLEALYQKVLQDRSGLDRQPSLIKAGK